MKNIISLLLVFIILPIITHAEEKSQDRKFKISSVSWWTGRSALNTKTQNAAQLDFLNFANHYSGDYYIHMAGISVEMQYMPQNRLILDWYIYDNPYPNSYKIQYQRQISDILVFNAGIIGFPISIRGYNSYFHEKYSDFHFVEYDLERNPFTQNVIVGAGARFRSERCFAHFDTNLTYSHIAGFTQFIRAKQSHSNFVKRLDYETHAGGSIVLYPQIKLGVLVIKREKRSLGIHFQSGMLLGNRRINYTLTTREWTGENYTREEVKSPKHFFIQNDMSAGIFMQFH